MRPPAVPDGEHRAVLAIADISGYTQFMSKNRESLRHGQIMISELIQALLDEAKLPLQVAKLEGDAVFLYALANPEKPDWAETSRTLRTNLLKFFDAFAEKRDELVQIRLCPCAGCSAVGELRLKLIVHAGTALFHRVGRFEELAGIDVILVHRLLKNTVPADEYLLMTQAAVDLLGEPEATSFEPMQQDVPGVGRIDCSVGMFVTPQLELIRIGLAAKLGHAIRTVWRSRMIAAGLRR